MKKHLYWFALVLLLSACSKSKDGDDDTGTTPGTGGAGTGITQMGAGMVYYDWATEGIQKVDLKTGVKGVLLQANTRRNSWDISRDHTWLLEVTEAPNNYDDELYTITNLKDGTIVSKFIKETGYANHSSPKFSYDKKLLAMPPTDDDGIMVLDLKGNILLNVATFQGKELEGEVEWMPDNTLLFRVDNSLYRSNKEFTQANLVTTLNFAEWNDFTVSPDGSKIALRGGNHLWMMNADGSKLTQITESNFKEVMPVFSPDSKYLLIGYDYTITGTFGRYWHLAMIPADFNKYTVDDKGTDKRVIQFIPKGETRAEASDGNMIWR